MRRPVAIQPFAWGRGAATSMRHQLATAYWQAREPVLRQLVSSLPAGPSSRVLDVACGSGAFALLFAETCAKVCAVEADPELLAIARQKSPTGETLFLHAHPARLPFAPAQFDLAFCAQGLAQSTHPRQVLREMLRVVRPRGFVAVLDNDALHELIVPWPFELELAVRKAQLDAMVAKCSAQDRKPAPEDYSITRNLRGLLLAEGAVRCSLKTLIVELHAPLEAAQLSFLRLYFAQLRQNVWPYLLPIHQRLYARLFDEGSPDELLLRADLHLTQLESLAVAERPDFLGPSSKVR